MDESGQFMARYWTDGLALDKGMRCTELCKAADFRQPWYLRWCGELKEDPRFHRKQWEYVYILQSLWERSCIGEGKRGLGFAVGMEPLPSLLAAHGCSVLATDIFPEEGIEKGWNNGQLCMGIQSLNTRGLCDDILFRERVAYRPVDMNDIPADLHGFDFTWSSCSFEHLGSIGRGIQFLENQMKTLKPGGWAVHTTEYNISSNTKTQDVGDTVIYRQRDMEELADRIRSMGHFVETPDYSLGGLPEDFMVDAKPHKQDVHIRLQEGPFIVTSIGIIIQKKA